LTSLVGNVEEVKFDYEKENEERDSTVSDLFFKLFKKKCEPPIFSNTFFEDNGITFQSF